MNRSGINSRSAKQSRSQTHGQGVGWRDEFDRKPALFYFSLEDKVVKPNKTIKFISNWGGEAETVNVKMTEFDDKHSHVVAGYILSPRQTEFARKTMVKWIESLTN